MPKIGLIVIVPLLVLLALSLLSAENIKIYDQNWNLRYEIENGNVYDKD